MVWFYEIKQIKQEAAWPRDGHGLSNYHDARNAWRRPGVASAGDPEESIVQEVESDDVIVPEVVPDAPSGDTGADRKSVV